MTKLPAHPKSLVYGLKTVYSWISDAFSSHCALFTVRAECAMCNAWGAMNSVQCLLCSMQRQVFSVNCIYIIRKIVSLRNCAGWRFYSGWRVFRKKTLFWDNGRALGVDHSFHILSFTKVAAWVGWGFLVRVMWCACWKLEDQWKGPRFRLQLLDATDATTLNYRLADPELKMFNKLDGVGPVDNIPSTD